MSLPPRTTPSAGLTAGLRALEGKRTDRPALVRDPFAEALAGNEGMQAAEAFVEAKPEAFENVLLRHRFIDDHLESLAVRGVERVIVLGAGLDTRPHRLPALRGIEWIEVDLPEAVAEKAARMRDLLPAPDPVRYLGLDLAEEGLAGVLARLDEPERHATVLVIEGLLCYLEPADALGLLAAAARWPASRRALLFDFFDPGYAEREGRNREALAQLARGGEEIRGLLEPAQVREAIGPGFTVEATTAREKARRLLGLDRDTAYLHYWTVST